MEGQNVNPNNWKKVLPPQVYTVFRQMMQMDVNDVAAVFDRAVTEKRDPNLCRQMMFMINAMKKVDHLKSEAPQEQRAPRPAILRERPVNLWTDIMNLPLVVNGHRLPSFLAADAEFIGYALLTAQDEKAEILKRRLKTGTPKRKMDMNVVASFSAIKISDNRAEFVPMLHVLIDYGEKTRLRDVISSQLNSLTAAKLERFIEPETFINILHTFSEKTTFLLWDPQADKTSVSNTCQVVGVSAEKRERILSSMKDIQMAYSAFLRKWAAPELTGLALEKMSLLNALRALRSWSAAGMSLKAGDTQFIQQLIHLLEESKSGGQKSSALDALAVATLVNHLSDHIPLEFMMQPGPPSP